MTRPARLHRSALLVAALLAAALAAPASADLGPVTMPDSTVLHDWRLENGLRVTARDIAGAHGIAVTLATPLGTDRDSADRRGLAEVSAEIAYTAGAGDVPARTREQMSSLRPLGWSLKVTPYATQMSEVASTRQLPGVLQELATRMRDLHVTPEILQASVATVRRHLGERYVGVPDQALYYRVREFALGRTEQQVHDLAAGRDLDRIGVDDVRAELATFLTPANCVLSLAGDLRGLDVPAIVKATFGSLAPGDPAPAPPSLAFHGTMRVEERSDVTRPVAVIGLFAPSLSDSMHPSFYLGMMVFGTQAKRTWGAPTPPVQSRFQYSILDDPALVRVYPKVAVDTRDPKVPQEEVSWTAKELGGMTVKLEDYDDLRHSVMWILGGPLPSELLKLVRRNPQALNTLSNTMATRELWGGEAYWAGYRARFNPRVVPGFERWARALASPRNEAVLMFVPAKKK